MLDISGGVPPAIKVSLFSYPYFSLLFPSTLRCSKRAATALTLNFVFGKKNSFFRKILFKECFFAPFINLFYQKIALLAIFRPPLLIINWRDIGCFDIMVRTCLALLGRTLNASRTLRTSPLRREP